MTATVTFEPAAPRRQVGEVDHPAESRVQRAEERRVPGNHEQRTQGENAHRAQRDNERGALRNDGHLALRSNERRAQRRNEQSSLRHLGPNWFAAVMGTGIVANAAVTLPLQFPGLRGAATVVWALAAAVLVAVSVAWLAHRIRFADTARDHREHPVMSQFFGAPPMALLTVGGGTLLLGGDVLGMPAAVAIDWVLWTAGTTLGLLTAFAIPYRMFTRHRVAPDAAFGGWLMPVVPPMVSATMGALLIPHTPAGQPRLTMLVLCFAMFGLSLFAALIIIAMIWSRLVHHGAPPAGMVPTLWIVLGPLGQSVTAAGLLATAAPAVLPGSYANGMLVFSVIFGIATWGFAMLWLLLALAVTVKTARAGELRFTLTWWGFTFPVGTCVTGSTVLYTHTGADLFAIVAVALFTMLVAAWAVVATHTLCGILTGALLHPTPAT